MYRHIVQTELWAEIKNKYGTPSVQVGEIFYTKHKLPKINAYFAYCPRVDPTKIDFDALKKSLKENHCVGLSFDVPNVLEKTSEAENALKILSKFCRKSTRSEFAKANVLMDLSLSEKELFFNMQSKHRYNTRLALKKGVYVEMAKSKEDFEDFFKLFQDTSIRQNFFIRPKRYYETIWEELHPKDICHILTAKFENKPLASWMIFLYKDVMYYPYGGSSEENKNLFASNALGWEVIRFGKKSECKIFDMWGAAEDPTNTSDSYYGFTNFKLKFGGKHVKYIDSYDLILNSVLYTIFTKANSLRWKLLEMGIIK